MPGKLKENSPTYYVVDILARSGDDTPTPNAGNIPTPAPLPTTVKLEKFAELTEDTYKTWAQTAKANLIVGSYWPFFCSKKPKPTTDSEDWE
jgi:hypothetical protein